MTASRWNSFGEALKFYRKSMRLTQEELAEKVGITSQAIVNYEGGHRTPRAYTVRKLANVLELDDDERKVFTELSCKDRTGRVDVLAQVDADEPAPLNTVVVTQSDTSSQSLVDAQSYMPSDATPRSAHRTHGATLQEFLTVLYNHYRGRPGKLLMFAMSLLATVGLVILSLTAVIYWRTDRYESVVTYANDEVLCAGVTDLCQTVSASVQGHVHMVCWQDAISFGGTKNRWFYVQALDGSEGFVHASAISQQIITPYCSKISWMNATAWALSEDGQLTIQPNARSGDDAAYWSSQSWLFAYNAWRFGAGHTPIHSAATAQLTWNLYKANGAWHAASNMPPRGSLVFFSYNSIGRVAVALGNGWVETTQGADDTQILPVTHMTIAEVGLTQVGYVPPNLV